MKTAILADLHLTACRTSVKHAVLDWLAHELRSRKPDLVVAIGDLTALGTEDQNQRLIHFLDGLGLPWCSTPGNAEFRTSSENARPWYVAPPSGAPLIFVDSANYEPPAADLEALAALPDYAGFLLATHVPPYEWPEVAQEALRLARQRGAVAAVIAGHQHDDGDDRLRGLDPDKSAGGPPMFELWDNGGGFWQREAVVMEQADIRKWPLAERTRLFSRFGVAAMSEPLETLEAARVQGIAHVELRNGPLLELDEPQLLDAIRAWREAGGQTLSLHLPSLTAEDDDGSLTDAAARAVRLGCDRVTLHVPAVKAADFPGRQEVLLANFQERMSPILDSPIDIGIENLHTSPGKEDDWHRNYGCTIGECRFWIELLRATTGSKRLGFHLDIGHARNNRPFNSAENVSDFYAELGGITNGCHFHQVTPNPQPGDSGNHTPFRGLYEKFISLAGYFLAWRAGQFPLNPPVYLEIRGNGLGLETYNTLKHLILE